MATPYETATLVAPMRQEAPTNMFLIDTLFATIETFDTATVDIDIVKGDERLAPLVSPKIEGKVMEELGFKTNSYKPAYVKPLMIIEPERLINFRRAGENPYDGIASDRELAWLAKQTTDGENQIYRREEWMASQGLFNGVVNVVGEGINQVIDFGMDASHKVTLGAGDRWDEPNSDPLQDLADWATMIADDGNANANILIGDATTIATLCKNQAVAKCLDNRRVNIGEINPTQLAPGVAYYGTLIANGLSIEIYSYMGSYKDDAGVRQRYVPAKKVLLTSTEADFRRNFGAIFDLEANLEPMMIFPKYEETFDPSVGKLLLQSAPLPAPHQIDAIVVAQVLA